jgi:AcrR family transcriptional regulator
VFSDKHRAILDAASRMFSQHGLRRASMDLIAERAQVAKPTIYAHFGSKDDLFAAVCTDVGERILAAARTAATTEGSVVDRVAAVLGAKFSVVFELVQSSPYAEELLHPAHPKARENIAQADVAFRGVLTGVLTSMARARELDLRRLQLPAAELTTQLMQIGYGAGYGAGSVDEQQRNLRALVASVLRVGLPETVGRRRRG